MPIIVGVAATWIAVTVFALIPKNIPLFEAIILFCADTIFELSGFSILHVNYKFIVVEPGVDNGIADLMARLIELPLLLVATSNLLLCSSRLKWGAVGLIVLYTLAVQQTLISVGVLSIHHWNLIYSGLLMCVNVLFSRAAAWAIALAGRKARTAS